VGAAPRDWTREPRNLGISARSAAGPRVAEAAV